MHPAILVASILALLCLLYSRRRRIARASTYYRHIFNIPGPPTILGTGLEYIRYTPIEGRDKTFLDGIIHSYLNEPDSFSREGITHEVNTVVFGSPGLKMAFERRNMFCKNKKRDTREIDFLNFAVRSMKDYPRIMKIWLFGTATILLFEPKDIEVLLASSKNINKGYVYTVIKGWMGDGVFISRGHKWKKSRKLLYQTFHVRSIANSLEIIRKHANRMVDEIVAYNSQPVQIKNITDLYTLDIIQDFAFGISSCTHKKEMNEYLEAVTSVINIVTKRVISVFHFDIVFKLSGMGKKFNKDVETLNNFANKIIEERLSEAKSGQTNGRDKTLLDGIIHSYLNEPDSFSREGITHEINTVIFGGFDTTSTSLTFTIFLLGVYQEVQEKVYQEVCEIFEDSEREVCLEDVTKMKYIEMVIRESLRIYPPPTVFSRQLTTPLELDGGIVVPERSHVMVPTYCVHRHPNHYHQPETFDPLRFSDEETAKRHRYAFLPFSSGPRDCIGKQFSMLEMKTIISTLVRRFSIVSLTSREELELMPGMVLSTTTPIIVKFIPRKT